MRRASQAATRRRPAVAAAVALTVLASCGLTQSQGAGGAVAMASQASGSSSATVSGSASSKASAPPADTLASRQASAGDGDITFRVDVTSVEVDGDLTTVRFTVTNLGKSDSWTVGSFFGHGSAEWNTSGLMLFAGDTREVYRSVEVDGECLCSRQYEGGEYPELDNISAGESRELATSFAAVPEDVQTVSVAIPGVGLIAGLPVTRK
ncbi:MAG: hypothetical protein Q3979_03315 [Actinomycetaceae bacterium]|nr:hypothetical protein [Actinomycetaceae bacterium]